jgi:hypothetical protein
VYYNNEDCNKNNAMLVFHLDRNTILGAGGGIVGIATGYGLDD